MIRRRPGARESEQGASLVALAIALSLIQASPARAQDSSPEIPELPPAQVPEPTAPPSGIEAIEVTGERLDSANVQDEAQAVTAFSMEDLDRQNIVNVDSLGDVVPSLHVGRQGNQAIITLRGIGTQNATVFGEPGVQFHVDGINYARPSAARVAFFDLETLRVNRGPQGTSGGKNATGGHIQVVTRKPADELEAIGDVEVGSYDKLRLRGALNIPFLAERLAGRFAFIQETHSGYQENLAAPDKDNRADDADDLGMRGHLRFTPTETLDALLSYNYYQADGVGPGAKQVGPFREVRCLTPVPIALLEANKRAVPPIRTNSVRNNADGTVTYVFSNRTTYHRGYSDRVDITRLPSKQFCQNLLAENTFPRPPSPDPRDARQVYLDQIQDQSNRIWGWATTIGWDLPELPVLGATRLTSLTGFELTSLSDPRDFDTTDIPYFNLDPVDNDSEQYSSELKLESAEGERLDWVGGLYYQRERSESVIQGSAFGSTLAVAIDQAGIIKSYGAYGEVNFHLTDALTLTTGARYSEDYKTSRLDRFNGNSANFSGVPSQLTCLSQQEVRERQQAGTWSPDDVPTCKDQWGWWTGGVALELRPTDQQLFYLQLDKGFKAGGFIIADSGKFDPERVLAYTAGSKSQFLDGRLTLNLEGFYYDYRDYQVVEIDGLTLRTENAPKAVVYGIETEFQAELMPGLRVGGQVAYTPSEFKEFRSVDPRDQSLALLARNGDLALSDYQDLSGNELPRTPKWSYRVDGEYEIPLGRWGSLTPRVQYSWQTDTYYRAFNSPEDLQEKYHKTDLKLTWTSPEEVWTAEAYVENIENDDVYQNLVIGSSAIGSPPLAYFAPPRLYGFRVGFRY